MAFLTPLPLRVRTRHWVRSSVCGAALARGARWRTRTRGPCVRSALQGARDVPEGGSGDRAFEMSIESSFDGLMETSTEISTEMPTETQNTGDTRRNEQLQQHPTAPLNPIKPHHLRLLLLRIRALQTINTATKTLTDLHQRPPTDEQLALHLGLTLPQLRTNRLSGIRARNDIVASHIHLVVKIASLVHARLSRQTPQSIPVEDLVQEGCIALITAAERYDASRGVKFMTYAWHVVYRACLREAPRGSIVSVPERLLQARRRVAARVAKGVKGMQEHVDVDETVPEHLLRAAEPHIRGALPLDAPSGNGERSYGELMRGGTSPEEVVERELVQREVRTACYRSLPERYAEVLIMRFGLNGSPPKSGKAIAGILGVSEPRVAQIVLAGIEKLRKLEPELAEFVYDI